MADLTASVRRLMRKFRIPSTDKFIDRVIADEGDLGAAHLAEGKASSGTATAHTAARAKRRGIGKRELPRRIGRITVRTR